MAGTNILANLELYRQRLALAKQYLLANDKTNTKAILDNMATDCSADSSTVNAATNVDTLTA